MLTITFTCSGSIGLPLGYPNGYQQLIAETRKITWLSHYSSPFIPAFFSNVGHSTITLKYDLLSCPFPFFMEGWSMDTARILAEVTRRFCKSSLSCSWWDEMHCLRHCLNLLKKLLMMMIMSWELVLDLNDVSDVLLTKFLGGFGAFMSSFPNCYENHSCGGTLIHTREGLNTRHCLSPGDKLVVHNVMCDWVGVTQSLATTLTGLLKWFLRKSKIQPCVMGWK